MKPSTILPTILSLITLATAEVKVATDFGLVRNIPRTGHSANRLYADDLSGCTVFAAHWAEVSSATQSIYIHICQVTLGDAAALDRLFNNPARSENMSLKTRLDGLTNNGANQPIVAELVVKATAAGAEEFQANNDRLRAYLNDSWGIVVPAAGAVNADYKYRANGPTRNARVELDPYDTPAIYRMEL